MNLIKRIYYRLIREFFKLRNAGYLRKFRQIAETKPSFSPAQTGSDAQTERPFYKAVADKEHTLIIHIPFGGLGDHLLYSHIPRLAKESGKYTTVLFSMLSLIRNKKHLEYIWARNPYLDGYCEESNPVDYNDAAISEFDTGAENILDRIMLAYGIDDGKRWHEPELYFDVPLIPELKSKSVFDPNFISYSGGLTSEKMEQYFLSHDIHIHYLFPARSSRAVPVTDFDSFIVDKDFEGFCSVLASCENLYTLTTGTATLAAALKRSATVFHGSHIDTYYLHSRQHTYVKL